jgi:futalosine hydrolase
MIPGASGRGLVCAATPDELQSFGLTGAEPAKPVGPGLWRIREGYAALTGVGTPVTLLRLAAWIETCKPAWMLNLGIAGAYPGSGLKIGDMVIGTSEVFADLGMETLDGGGFLPMGETPFTDPWHRKPLPLWVPEWVVGLAAESSAGTEAPRVRLGRGATVNTCAGREATGRMRREIFDADFESMEGAAVALAGMARGLPVFEARAISNAAADRDMRPENIRLALRALRTFWEAHRSELP